MATHSRILAWRITRAEEPGRLQSMGLQRVGCKRTNQKESAQHSRAPGVQWSRRLSLVCPVSVCLRLKPPSFCVITVWYSIVKGHVQSSVQFSRSVVTLCDPRPPCPSPTPGVHLNPCPLSRWCHPTISSSVIPFSSCPESLPASGSFQMSQLFASRAKVLEL